MLSYQALQPVKGAPVIELMRELSVQYPCFGYTYSPLSDDTEGSMTDKVGEVLKNLFSGPPSDVHSVDERARGNCRVLAF